jgi:hypothetical protein
MKFDVLKRANKTKSPRIKVLMVRSWPYDGLSAIAKRWRLLTTVISRIVPNSYASPYSMFGVSCRCCHAIVITL